MQSHINIGTGKDITIRELAEVVGKIVGYTGKIAFDSTKPDGAPRKLLDISRLELLGCKPSTSLTEGLKKTFDSYLLERG